MNWTVEQRSSQWSMGMTSDKILKLDLQIQIIASQALRIKSMLYSLINHNDPLFTDHKLTLYTTLVRPIIPYGSQEEPKSIDTNNQTGNKNL